MVSVNIVYAVAVCNIIILLFLMENFYHIYKNFRSDFTLGLLLFTVLLFFKNVVHAWLVLPFIVVGSLHSGSIAGFRIVNISLIPDILELIALSIFLYLSRKY
ncbi:MAG: hypothetical protein SCH39_11655 [Methanosarcinales archaeon]|nr:hypothetical protein [Methanosarcinales archaeon]